ncbi:DNA cytosine methyltransferase [Salmonella enterica subsp. enterica serovar Senftenberg]|nr:DNA cytosine methyltransferase [Salmonella enterica subsp. enterica serovar Senftenberg]
MTDRTVVEICAGAGGQSLGLHKAGFRHELAIELDVSAAHTLHTNLKRLQGEADVRVGDVADETLWSPEAYEGIDLLAGGVPCPPFSVAGKQLGSQDERDLFAWAVELAGRVQPRALLLENVRGLSMPRFAGYRQAVAERLEELGYWSEWKLLHASDFGVPQLRPRFVLIALRAADADYFAWPEPEDQTASVGDTLRELMNEHKWRHVDEWVSAAQGIGPTIVGGSKKHGGADLGPTRAKQAWAKLGVDAHGVADAAPERDAPPPSVKRPRLTNAMVAAIQGWGPEYHWRFEGRKTSVYRQIGNAFPPPVAHRLGQSIKSALGHEAAAALSRQDGTVHDEVYRALRNSTQPLSEAQLLEVVAKSHNLDQLRNSLEALGRDFELIVETEGMAPRYLLGEFKAFRGQSGHFREQVFADRRGRSKVS